VKESTSVERNEMEDKEESIVMTHS